MAKQNNNPYAVNGINVTSPKGKALWCKVKDPDRTYDQEGTLSTSLVCDPKDPAVQKFIEVLEALRDTALAETKETLLSRAKDVRAASVYSDEVDKEGNETGNIVFKFKLGKIDSRKAAGKNHSITVFDAKKNILTVPPLVGNGSEIRCVAYANPYYMASTKMVGISLIWSKMQIIQLNEYSAKGGDDFDVEDGFEATTTNDSPFDTDDDADF